MPGGACGLSEATSCRARKRYAVRRSKPDAKPASKRLKKPPRAAFFMSLHQRPAPDARRVPYPHLPGKLNLLR